MWSRSWETPGRRGPEPPEVARETQLHRRSRRKTPAPQSGRAAPEAPSSSWKWRARPAGKSYAFLDSCCSSHSSFQGLEPRRNPNTLGTLASYCRRDGPGAHGRLAGPERFRGRPPHASVWSCRIRSVSPGLVHRAMSSEALGLVRDVRCLCHLWRQEVSNGCVPWRGWDFLLGIKDI